MTGKENIRPEIISAFNVEILASEYHPIVLLEGRGNEHFHLYYNPYTNPHIVLETMPDKFGYVHRTYCGPDEYGSWRFPKIVKIIDDND